MAGYKPKRPVRREFTVEGFRNPIIVVVHPNGVIEMNEKRKRQKFTATVGKLYLLAVKTEVEKQLESKKRRSSHKRRSLAG